MGQTPEGNAAAYIFREAVRRQSKKDLETFKASPAAEPSVFPFAAGLPWCWRHDSLQDVLWVSQLSDDSSTAQRNLPGFTRVADDEIEGGPSVSSTLSQQRMLPVIFGRPDFGKELPAISAAYPDEDVNVYVCGGGPLVKSLQTVCGESTAPCKESGKRGKYNLFHERFG